MHIDHLINLVLEGHDPKLVMERVLSSVQGRPAEISIRRRANASSDLYFGGEVLSAETSTVNGQQVVIWTIRDQWSGRKITGV